MLVYDNEYETKENKNWTKDKIKPQKLRQITKWIINTHTHNAI